MIDTHSHLADPLFDDDIGEVIARAKAAGVERAIVCAEFRDDFERILALADRFPDFVSPALGVHPVQRGNTSAADHHMEGVEEFVREHADRLAAVGEVGLDFTPRYIRDSATDHAAQRAVLKRQVALGNELGLPVNVHSRSAGGPVIACLLGAEPQHGVQLHAFSGSLKSAGPALAAEDFYFSVPPSFTINPQRDGLIKTVPLERLLLESDSPVLGVDKTARNEPANIRLVADHIARLKGVSVDQVIAATTANARRLYPRLSTK